MDRVALEARWLRLTREVLPGLAVARGWPVHADHCFQRILLDHAVGGRWYERIAGRPAYRHLDAERLLAAVALGDAVAAGSEDLAALNRQSLAWRRASYGKGIGAGGQGVGVASSARQRARASGRHTAPASG